MSGSALKIDIEYSDKKMLQALNRLAEAGSELKPAFAEIGEALLNSHRARWKKEESAEGERWAPLSVQYQKSKSKNADKLLIFEQFLHDTLAYHAADSSVELGTNIIYGATHQFGDDSRNIPARSFLGVSAEDEEMILNTLHDHFAETLD